MLAVHKWETRFQLQLIMGNIKHQTTDQNHNNDQNNKVGCKLEPRVDDSNHGKPEPNTSKFLLMYQIRD